VLGAVLRAARAGAFAHNPVVARLVEIWSGGQSGVDRAAHDAALEAGVAIRGWVPCDRWAEDGRIADRYEGLVETDSDDLAVRTELNVRDSDATLILTMGPPTGGTEWTRRCALAHERPVLVIDLEIHEITEAVRRASAWLDTLPSPIRLNVAGPRASKAPAVSALARTVILQLLSS
jgi:hypothetical protein